MREQHIKCALIVMIKQIYVIGLLSQDTTLFIDEFYSCPGNPLQSCNGSAPGEFEIIGVSGIVSLLDLKGDSHVYRDTQV